MAARNTMRAAYGVTAVVLLAGGLWVGRSLSTSTATPQAKTGIIGFVSPGGEDEFTIRLSGRKGLTHYAMPATVQWRDGYGTWYEGTRPACMKPWTHGQQVTLGLVTTEPVADAPGGPVIVWLECASKPVPRFPVVTPSTTRQVTTTGTPSAARSRTSG
jgi:hypothetical protein